MKDGRIEAGDILCASFGYEAQLTDFYKVVKRTPKQVELVRLKERCFDYHGMEGWMVEPTDEEIGDSFRRKVKADWYDGEECVKVRDYGSVARLWSGKPIHNYNWH